MAKRKRPLTEGIPSDPFKAPKIQTEGSDPGSGPSSSKAYFQIIAGSYDRTLHGVIATVKPSNEKDETSQNPDVAFHENFLFTAHSSAIRCLTISPKTESTSSSSVKVTLATGGTDERVNVYQLDASMPTEKASTIRLGAKTLENPKNKELGSLLHHSSSISALHFPSKGKLLSAAEDNTVAVIRTRDWTVLSTIKAPVPRVVGRPSGDTAGPGEVPMGINDFAVHPSKKLMISVGRGEKCMRLWNLVTGKKAGVLNFERDLLTAVGEGKWARGEGLKVEWSPKGDEFAVAFERGVVVFSMESEPKGMIRPNPLSKVHQMRYITDDEHGETYLAVSTEDGRIIIFSTTPPTSGSSSVSGEPHLLQALGQLGGQVAGFHERIKDFEILLSSRDGDHKGYVVITGSSDGNIRIWELRRAALSNNSTKTTPDVVFESKQQPAKDGDKVAKGDHAATAPQIGTLLGNYNTSSRITCLRVFEMIQPTQDAEQNGVGQNHIKEPKGEANGTSGLNLDPPIQGGSESAAGSEFEEGFEGFD